MPKKIFTQELERTRRRGRSRKRWKEEVERDLQVLGVRRWRELVADKKKWKDFFDRPKPTVGCNANGIIIIIIIVNNSKLEAVMACFNVGVNKLSAYERGS